MYEQRTVRRSGEIKLVRMSQYDGRGPRFDQIGKKRKSKLMRLLSVFCMVILTTTAGVFSGVRFVLADDNTGADIMKIERVQLSDSINAEPEEPDAEVGEIVPLAEEQEPRAPLVVLDPGHGGEDEGCSREDVMEKTVNLQIAIKLAEKLRNMGYEVVLTREDDDTEVTLKQRVEIAEAAGGDIFISIHQNACDEKESSASGIETWFYGCPEKVKGENWFCTCCNDSRRLAALVQNGAVSSTAASDRGLQESQELYVIRETSMPSCLVETSFLSNRKEREAISDEEYQDKLISGIAKNIDYYFNPKTMYLTFDDGPSKENTAAVLDILMKRGIKATFFVVGENVLKNPDIARRIVDEGHTIGIHCNEHDYNKIYASVDSFLEDFQAAYDAVYEVTGVEVQLFRFPGGSINSYNKDVYEEIIEKMTERGFVYFDWNGSLEDAAKKNDPEVLLRNARESTLGRKKVVMLAHDIKYNTVLCLEDLIDQFSEYKMEPLTPEVAPIQF